jgi:hypothetical protein
LTRRKALATPVHHAAPHLLTALLLALAWRKALAAPVHHAAPWLLAALLLALTGRKALAATVHHAAPWLLTALLLALTWREALAATVHHAAPHLLTALLLALAWRKALAATVHHAAPHLLAALLLALSAVAASFAHLGGPSLDHLADKFLLLLGQLRPFTPARASAWAVLCNGRGGHHQNAGHAQQHDSIPALHFSTPQGVTFLCPQSLTKRAGGYCTGGRNWRVAAKAGSSGWETVSPAGRTVSCRQSVACRLCRGVGRPSW